MLKKNVVLVGPMGAGKTTIGLLLSKSLGMSFVDVDHEIEARAGANIPWIFEKEGEEGFRKRESVVLSDLSQRNGVVIATGGGAVGSEKNRAIIKSAGVVIYLSASIEQQLIRTSKDKNRPLLQNQEPRKILTQLMTHREPLYKEVAHIVIATDKRSPKLVAKEILQKLLEEYGF